MHINKKKKEGRVGVGRVRVRECRTLKIRNHGRPNMRSRGDRHAGRARAPLPVKRCVSARWSNPPSSMASCP